jgi:superfamily II DNA or RNA helicase
MDLAVAFVTASGLQQIEPNLLDMINLGGHVRVLTGDYLDVTEPRALHRLFDLMQEYPDQVEVRVFQTDTQNGFHPKAYVIHRDADAVTAYIGSSNLTKHALLGGIEWNQRIVGLREEPTIAAIVSEFQRLFDHQNTASLGADWIETYEKRRRVSAVSLKAVGVEQEAEIPAEVPVPHSIQEEALEALKSSRGEGNRAGLVVLATGLGKTWLSAFDSVKSERVLFVAHREEILTQALNTFRRIRPEASLGLYKGGRHDRDSDVLFASIQTLGKQNHLRRFAPDQFDYIIVDEFHHAAAATYRRLIDYFDPEFLLGLTATPERTDGGDLLALCGENLVYRCDLIDGIERKLLCPFAYYGVPDDVDFSNIPWRSGRFDPALLEHAVATDKRAQNAFEQWDKHGNTRTLAFCVSQRHANFMSDYFQERGVKAVAVHSGPESAPRSQSLKKLQSGEFQVVFAVDMFNEGVDVPMIDTVLMLRPTESKILWLQQFGRGLRVATDKARLVVIDYIGNHKTFLNIPSLLIPGFGNSPGEISRALAALRAGELALPDGCTIKYELEAIEILERLAQPPGPGQQVIQWYRSFRELHNRRPTATEAYHEGYEPKKLKTQFGSWLNFVANEGDLSEDELAAYQSHREFLDALEVTPMTKSFKMVTLLGMIATENFPGDISIDVLIDQTAKLGGRIRALRDEFGDALNDRQKMRQLLENNPINAWLRGKGMGDKQYFTYDDGKFSSFSVAQSKSASLRDLTQEICDYRLAQYLDRLQSESGLAPMIVCKVSHSNGKPIIFLPDRAKIPGIPEGWVPVIAKGEQYQANFVKIAVNVFRREDEGEKNELPRLLRSFFGENAGQSGTSHQVRFLLRDNIYHLEPLSIASTGAERWHEYMREEIPPLWGLEFNPSKWQQGFVRHENHMFLLVSLDKQGMAEEHQYEDRFLNRELFQWVSQNRTKRASETGRRIAEHEKNGAYAHLFVRDKRKTPAGKAAPFVYCGDVSFVDWNGDQPITVRWRLKEALPESLIERFQ